MNRFYQQFFWMPTETLSWIKSVVPALRLWTVLGRVGKDQQLIPVTDLQPDMFEKEEADAVQMFLGSPDLSTEPEWDEEPGRRSIDFGRSYAIHFVPAILTPDHKTLLEGRMAIFRLDQYEDYDKATRLSELFQRLQKSMKQESDRSRVIYELYNGQKKYFRSMLVGADVPGRNLTLKHTAKNPVTFGIE